MLSKNKLGLCPDGSYNLVRVRQSSKNHTYKFKFPLRSEWREAQPCNSASKGGIDLIGSVRESFPKEVMVELILKSE